MAEANRYFHLHPGVYDQHRKKLDDAYDGQLNFIDLTPDSPGETENVDKPDMDPSQLEEIVGDIRTRFRQIAVIAAAKGGVAAGWVDWINPRKTGV